MLRRLGLSGQPDCLYAVTAPSCIILRLVKVSIGDGSFYVSRKGVMEKTHCSGRLTAAWCSGMVLGSHGMFYSITHEIDSLQRSMSGCLYAVTTPSIIYVSWLSACTFFHSRHLDLINCAPFGNVNAVQELSDILVPD